MVSVCGACGGELRDMGALGSYRWMRCVGCGYDVPVKETQVDNVEIEEEEEENVCVECGYPADEYLSDDGWCEFCLEEARRDVGGWS